MGTAVSPEDEQDVEVVDPAAQVSAESPMVVIPRGGTREVGRSCYQVETLEGTYLVDCGLNQGDGGQFPDFRGLDEHSIDAVFLTHAHIDHIGGLPVLEHRDLLAPNAKIICTAATAAIADVLLHDSLQIHKEEAKKPGRRRRFTRPDVEEVLDRFDPVNGYQEVDPTTGIPGLDDDITANFGNAGHLLGSSWLALESAGRRVVFSGDLGGRSAHLPEIDEPPTADTLFIESTYGDRDTHPSFSDARTELYETAIDAVEQGIPVLIPTFAVGRAQEILQIFRERWRDLPEDIREDLDIVYDGMATEATDRYHAYATHEYVAESVMNYIENAADFEPFVPDCAWRPTHGGEREQVLDGENAPIIVAPSGMLTGGLSPAYLLELERLYDEARIIFTGYQAHGTPGRVLQQATGTEVTTDIRAWPIGGWDDADESSDENEGGVEDEMVPEHEVTIPTRWVRTINGMSGHAARNRLLQFAREVSPDHVALVHGDPHRQEAMIDHFDGNVDCDTITPTAIQSPIPVYEPERDLTSVDTTPGDQNVITVRPDDTVDEEMIVDPIEAIQSDAVEDGDEIEVDRDGVLAEDEIIVTKDWVEHIEARIRALAKELNATRHSERSEDELREIVRDEIEDYTDTN